MLIRPPILLTNRWAAPGWPGGTSVPKYLLDAHAVDLGRRAVHGKLHSCCRSCIHRQFLLENIYRIQVAPLLERAGNFLKQRKFTINQSGYEILPTMHRINIAE